MENKKRLSKVLASAGIASRRASEELIFKGRVTVNDEVILVPQTLVCTQKDQICVDNEPIQSEKKKVYYILNKPHGFICSNAPLGKKKRIFDLIAHLPYPRFTKKII